MDYEKLIYAKFAVHFPSLIGRYWHYTRHLDIYTKFTFIKFRVQVKGGDIRTHWPSFFFPTVERPPSFLEHDLVPKQPHVV